MAEHQGQTPDGNSKAANAATPSATPGEHQDLDGQSKQLALEAGLLHKWLKTVLESSAASKGNYAFKDRTKPWYEIRQKVIAKRNHENQNLRKPNYKVKDISDASGFRIVSLFNAEIPSALEKLFALLKVRPASDPDGRFLDNPVREVLFFSSRRIGDPLSIRPQVEKIVREHGFQDKFDAPSAVDEEGHTSSYSSVHIIVDGEVGDGDHCIQACSEIQLRSVFEEAWGEINHRLKYAPAKQDRALGREDQTDDANLAQTFLHLDALKSFTDGCAQYADLISAQIAPIQPREASRNPRSVSPVAESLRPFQVCEETVRRAVEAAFDLRQKAEDAKPGDAAMGGTFVTASKAFAEALAALRSSEHPRDTAQRTRLIDLLREEIAYCQMFSGNAELRSQAETAYRDLLITNSKNPSALLRLGQIRRDAGDFGEARDLMEQGLEAAEADGTKRGDQTKLILRQELAVVLWRVVDLDSKHPEALKLLNRAIELARAASDQLTQSPPDQGNERRRLIASANLLYFLVDLANRTTGEQQQVAREAATSLLSELRPLVRVDETRPLEQIGEWTVRKLDTMLRAERDVGLKAAARKHAVIILKRLQHKMDLLRKSATNPDFLSVFDQLSRDDKDMYLCAQAVLADPSE